MILDKKNQNKNIGKVDFGVLYTILILLAIGVVMIYSASSFYSMFHYNDSMFYLKKQGIMAVIGLLFYVIISFITSLIISIFK